MKFPLFGAAKLVIFVCIKKKWKNRVKILENLEVFSWELAVTIAHGRWLASPKVAKPQLFA